MTLNQTAATRRNVVTGALATGAAIALRAGSATARPPAGKPPNIVFILADDLGYADLSAYGRGFATPSIDRIAGEGLLLMQGYANSSVCSPTRVALITGRYQYRLPVGLDEPLTGTKPALGLDPKHPTLPSLLRKLGYRTALVGKWHMGDPPAFGPRKSGYDHFFGFHHGFQWYFGRTEKPPLGLYDNDRQVAQTGYLTDVLGDKAVEIISGAARGQQPLFLSLHFNAPHWPWEGPEDAAASPAIRSPLHADGGNLKTYAAMIAAMDRNVAKVLAALDAAGIADDTIVIMTSDNGGERYSDVWPLTGMKGELLEGGIRVPVLVRWPARIAAGRRSEQVLVSMDWLPTLLAAAGGVPDRAYPSDGENLLRVLTGEAAIRPRKLFWRYKANEQAAVRDGDWKYLKLGGYERLFDVAVDPRERADLKERHSKVFARLKADYAAWNAAMPPYPADSVSHNIKGHTADRY